MSMDSRCPLRYVCVVAMAIAVLVMMRLGNQGQLQNSKGRSLCCLFRLTHFLSTVKYKHQDANDI